jgi:hypothetical protein
VRIGDGLGDSGGLVAAIRSAGAASTSYDFTTEQLTTDRQRAVDDGLLPAAQDLPDGLPGG